MSIPKSPRTPKTQEKGAHAVKFIVLKLEILGKLEQDHKASNSCLQ